MNQIDIIVIAIIIISALFGLYWGIIRQVLSIVGLVAGIAVASRYAPNVAEWLTSFLPDTALIDVFAYGIVVIGVSALASLLASLLHGAVGLLFLGWADHLLGAVLGAIQGALLATVLVAILAANQSEALSPILRESQIAAPMVQAFGFILALMPESIRTSAEIFFSGL